MPESEHALMGAAIPRLEPFRRICRVVEYEERKVRAAFDGHNPAGHVLKRSRYHELTVEPVEIVSSEHRLNELIGNRLERPRGCHSFEDDAADAVKFRGDGKRIFEGVEVVARGGEHGFEGHGKFG